MVIYNFSLDTIYFKNFKIIIIITVNTTNNNVMTLKSTTCFELFFIYSQTTLENTVQISNNNIFSEYFRYFECGKTNKTNEGNKNHTAHRLQEKKQ